MSEFTFCIRARFFLCAFDDNSLHATLVGLLTCVECRGIIINEVSSVLLQQMTNDRYKYEKIKLITDVWFSTQKTKMF